MMPMPANVSKIQKIRSISVNTAVIFTGGAADTRQHGIYIRWLLRKVCACVKKFFLKLISNLRHLSI